MTLREQIGDDMKSALRARETARLGAIRLLLAAIKQREVDERITLDDDAVIGVIGRMLKQRRESVSQYRAAGRNDLADAEQFEADLLEAYLPAALSDAELDTAIATAIAATGASRPADMGRVMTTLKATIAGRADMTAVSQRVKARLTNA
ncbi:GatB/YqeY domain-containing protein [Rhodocyclus tenuis]|uniref:GatB/YqeY domain-containing protein n=1 Tax=Rhodocyclus gracilis TaxID=2929842 RepID=A0ABX0WFH7_9RHOO|nr:GatB/YqeY domain-containing protein [Rhodocyclus gracilis]MRD72755.1 GatB/YqeY domain-containing protein [Rhodocyclus gracilis]NJA88284.1 GatB/YqeY domain-containing protein [Rhodocyclus gracilis]